MIKKLALKIFFKKIHNVYHYIRRLLFYIFFYTKYRIILNRIKRKEQIKVAFYLFNADSWKAESVYEAFEEDHKYIPYIVVCPIVNKGDKFLNEQFKRCVDLLENKKYRFIIGFKGKTEETVEYVKLPNFDIVFFLNPNSLSIPEFNFFNSTKSLNCYIPYSYNIDKLIDYDFDNFVLNAMFRVFSISEYHHKMYKIHSERKGKNTYLSGFPQLDRFNLESKNNPWKYNSKRRKKIIWGPHWTLPGLQDTSLDWGCFLDYSDYMLKLADKYLDKVELALKPHPFLFNLLEKNDNWGSIKVKDYIKSWTERENCQIVQGDYTDLFIHSDALIHDSGSFAVEYLFLNKPIAYTINNNSYMSRFNEVGKMAIELHYKLFSFADLENFFINVINENDELKSERAVFKKRLLIENGNSGSRIVKHLNDIIL